MTSLTRWLPAITTAKTAKTALAAAGIAVTAPALAGPAAAKAAPSLTTAKKPAKDKELRYQYKAQENYYYCGPAAARIAASANGHTPSQDDMARKLGTTTGGTNSAEDTTRVLNATVKGDPYRTRMIPGGAATPAQMDRLQADVVAAITDGRGVVVNVAGSATDTDGGWHSFPGGHYVAVVGYQDEGRLVKIADSANPATASYWMSTIALANWAATRGYSA